MPVIEKTATTVCSWCGTNMLEGEGDICVTCQDMYNAHPIINEILLKPSTLRSLAWSAGIAAICAIAGISTAIILLAALIRLF